MADQIPDYTELIDTVKTVLRVSSDAYDEEVEILVSSALADILRVGVNPEYVSGFRPLVKQAVCLYCKANFGYDNEEAARFQESYRQCVTDMLNSSENIAAGEQS